MASPEKILPVLPAGFRDYLPEEMIARNSLIETVRVVFERFGFVPIDTPCVERTDVLTGNEVSDMQIFSVPIPRARYSAALRFDLTVPLASFVTRNLNSLSFPFKRYHLGKVWRSEKPQKGRYREFIQFDVDVVGVTDVIVDAEIVAIMDMAMHSLGFSNFIIRINNRKILNGLADYASFDSVITPGVLRSIDKLDKQGWEAVEKELVGKDFGLNLSLEQADLIRRFVLPSVDVTNPDIFFPWIRDLMSVSEQAFEGIDELEMMSQHINALGVKPENWKIDLSVARGLGYYTGPVFETMLTDLPEIGSVFSGGRYDGLVSRFGSQDMPATGASLGFDRIFAAMQELNLIKSKKVLTEVLVANFDSNLISEVQTFASVLRNAGIPTEIYFDGTNSLREQISFALKQGIRYIVLYGESEKESGAVQVKDLDNRTQEAVDIGNLLRYFTQRIL